MVPIDTLRVQQYYTFLLQENINIFKIITGFFYRKIVYEISVNFYHIC